MENQINKLFSSKLVVINVGPKIFGDAVRLQGVDVLQVDWKPLAGGDQEMIDLLESLGGI
ncbi:MAG TPA: fdrA domain protein [Clostridiales bacterium]|nr:fdrA domain protein [Clostridiales bacterium]